MTTNTDLGPKTTTPDPWIIAIHITHNCNLTCDSCSDMTNIGLNWMITKDEFVSWIKNWNGRIKPDQFHILGGEPTLHKDLVEFLYIARELWGQDQEIRLMSNGFFVDRHENLGKVLKETNTSIDIGLHSKKEDYLGKLKDNILLMKKWREEEGTTVNFMDFTEEGSGWNPSGRTWRRIYKGYGASMLPYEDNDPEASWENCWMDGARCFQLYQGNLWKCPPITYLPEAKKKYGDLLSEKWDPYLAYEPLKPECSDEELMQFWKSECLSICSMCPAKTHYIDELKNPLMSVSESEKYYQSTEPVT
jgi:hypothetical protein